MTREIEAPEIPASKLISAGHPPGATVTHILRARWWRSVDERKGAGYSMRHRIRRRKKFREAFTYVPNNVAHVPHRITLGGGYSGRRA